MILLPAARNLILMCGWDRCEKDLHFLIVAYGWKIFALKTCTLERVFRPACFQTGESFFAELFKDSEFFLFGCCCFSFLECFFQQRWRGFEGREFLINIPEAFAFAL